MDVLYTYRKDDGWNLRMSLRSLCMNGANLGRVIIAGDKPDWLTGVEHVPVNSPFQRKQKNILYAIITAMERLSIDRPILYSADDHFMLRPYDLENFPWFRRKRTLLPDEHEAPVKNCHPYWASLVATRNLLASHGYPIDMVNGHVNTHLDGRDLPVVKELAGKYWETLWGYEPSTLFIACARRRDPSMEFIVHNDVKIGTPITALDFLRFSKEGDGLISVAKAQNCGELRECMENMFPHPCRFEA